MSDFETIIQREFEPTIRDRANRLGNWARRHKVLAALALSTTLSATAAGATELTVALIHGSRAAAIQDQQERQAYKSCMRTFLTPAVANKLNLNDLVQANQPQLIQAAALGCSQTFAIDLLPDPPEFP